MTFFFPFFFWRRGDGSALVKKNIVASLLSSQENGKQCSVQLVCKIRLIMNMDTYGNDCGFRSLGDTNFSILMVQATKCKKIMKPMMMQVVDNMSQWHDL
jgi:hypothetical protein